MVQLTKNIESLIEEGSEITVGRLPPFDCVATATDETARIAMLVRREGETLNQLIKRLDKAIQLAWTDDLFVDELNDGQSDRLRTSSRGPLSHAYFSDDFDANPLGVNLTPIGWSVSAGTVDIIGSPGFFDLAPGNGRYVDLDGTSNDAGVLSKTFALTAGLEYTVSFDLAGSHRTLNDETVVVTFGTTTATYVVPTSVDFATHFLSFVPVASGNYTLSFSNLGGDERGALLDRVVVASVPEPSAALLTILGLAVVGRLSRTRETGQRRTGLLTSTDSSASRLLGECNDAA